MNDFGNVIFEYCVGVMFFFWVCGDVGWGGFGCGFCYVCEVFLKIVFFCMLGLVGRCVNVGVGYWVL